jgi:metal-dependent hydrolase (beta-lactamase superfamily II)
VFPTNVLYLAVEREGSHIPDSMCERVNGKYVTDLLADDLSLFIRTDLGLVIVLGCAHRGVINIIRHAQRLRETDDVASAKLAAAFPGRVFSNSAGSVIEFPHE